MMCTSFLCIGAFLVVLVTNYLYNWIYVVRKTWRRDLRALVRFTKLNFNLWLWERQKKTLPKIFSQLSRKHPGKIAFHFEDDAWTFAEVDAFSNKIANFFNDEGFQRGDTVSLLLENRPEYLCIWLGLAKLGVVTALINTNLVNDPLVHSITVSNSRAVIYGESFAATIKQVLEKFGDLRLYQFNNKGNKKTENGAVDLTENLKNGSSTNIVASIDAGDPKDNLIYIYTSGTTGLPKAAVITNRRCAFMTLGVYYMVGYEPDDILYDCLPLYHSAGGLIGACQTLLCGVTTVIRKKFSASNFWKDCAKYNCTVAGYIGEICRYLLAAHEHSKEPIEHKVRAMYGNGLRPQIWNQFVEKFHVAEIYELYGATEGNANLINIDSTPGAIGFVPKYAGFLHPLLLIKYDEATGEPIRNRQGFCIKCGVNEPGLVICRINPKRSIHDFSGYADKKESEKKRLSNVFKVGDAYFNSGDILVTDELGNFYFKDRIGDTFRWKGENVATSEVEAVISNLIDFTDAVVYGVQIPGTEGRAGMAALVDTNNSLDIDKLALGIKQNLPSYAIPLFLRVMATLPMTGTFKLKKCDLQEDGFNVTTLKDDIYFYNTKLCKYEKLTPEIYRDIINEKVKL